MCKPGTCLFNYLGDTELVRRFKKMNRKSVTLCILGFFFLSLSGKTFAITDDNTKEVVKISLNGLWDFVIDLDPRYHSSPRPSYARPGWDRRYWMKVQVPGVWNKYTEKLDIYEGVCWYARDFQIDTLAKTATALLRFGAVNYKCRVFLNNQLAGTHEGGYTEFVTDVSKHVRKGHNYLAVEVDNRATVTKLPVCLGWFNYGGIHRDVTLEIFPDSFVKDVFFDGQPNGKNAQLRIKGRVMKYTKGLSVRVRCNNQKSEYTLNGDTFDIKLDVGRAKSWSPKMPNLYPASISLMREDQPVHTITRDIGFRTIAVADSKVFLNDKPIFLKGICYLYDSPAFGLVMKPEQFDRDIAQLKEIGVNTIRSHFPFSEDFYNACDKAGLMVWIEPMIYSILPKTGKRNTAFANPAFMSLANAMMHEMILQARSHPCVILYSVGNECNVENPEALAFFRSLSNKINELDNTRLTSYASLYCNVGPMTQFVDILGINEYWGWYDRIFKNDGLKSSGLVNEEKALRKTDGKLVTVDLQKLDDKLSELEKRHTKPMLLTEFGADSKPGYISNSRNLWSEDYHADIFRETFAILQKHPRICGAFPFCFSDYRDPSKHVNGYWDYMNYKGVVSYNRKPKKPFYVLKDIYKNFPSGSQ